MGFRKKGVKVQTGRIKNEIVSDRKIIARYGKSHATPIVLRMTVDVLFDATVNHQLIQASAMNPTGTSTTFKHVW